MECHLVRTNFQTWIMPMTSLFSPSNIVIEMSASYKDVKLLLLCKLAVAISRNSFSADRNGRTNGTVLRPSVVVCDVKYCGSS